MNQLPFDVQLIILDKYQTMIRDIQDNKRMVLEDLRRGFEQHWEHYNDLMFVDDADWPEDSYINSLRCLPLPDDPDDTEAWTRYLNTYRNGGPDVDDWFWNHWHNPSRILVDTMKY